VNRIVLPFLFFAGDCLAHPGHGATLIHTHGWDWTTLALGFGVLVLAVFAIGRVK